MADKLETIIPSSIRFGERVQGTPRRALPKRPFGLQVVRDPANGQVHVISPTASKDHARKRLA